MPFTHDKAYGSSNLPAPIIILGNLPVIFLYFQATPGPAWWEERGHVAEWFNAPYLKYDVPRYHEFESHLVRFILQSSYPVPLTKETIFP